MWRTRLFLRNSVCPFAHSSVCPSFFGITRVGWFGTFHFSTPKKSFWQNCFQKSSQVNFCFQETGVLEELGRFERHWHVRRKKLLPLMRLFWARLPWRGGKWLNMCRKPRLGTENDFNHLDFFVAKFLFRGRILFSKRWGFGGAMNLQALLARPT